VKKAAADGWWMVAMTVTPPRASDDSNLVRARVRALTLTLT